MGSRQVRALDVGLTRLYLARLAAQLAWFTRLTVALLLFIGALQVMKAGAQGFDVFKEGGPGSGSALDAQPRLAGALLLLSGSPIAASALSLVAGRSISEAQRFTMLTGSRIGAAFVVLPGRDHLRAAGRTGSALSAGFYGRDRAVRDRVRIRSLRPCSVTPCCNGGPFRALEPSNPPQLINDIDIVYGGVVDLAATRPPVVAFVGGFLLLLMSLKLVDSVIPELGEDSIERSWATSCAGSGRCFALGWFVALISMSVPVALTVLVPPARNVVRCEDIVPYIMGPTSRRLGTRCSPRSSSALRRRSESSSPASLESPSSASRSSPSPTSRSGPWLGGPSTDWRVIRLA